MSVSTPATEVVDNARPHPQRSAGRWGRRLKALAAGSFLFFFVKGLVWLAIFAAMYFGIVGQ